MGTKTTTSKKSVQGSVRPNACVFVDSVTTVAGDVDLADVIQPVFVPGGTDVHRVTIKNTDLDSNGTPALAAKIGFTPADGSTAASGADTAVASAASWGQSAATTAYEIFPPYRVEVDSWLNIVVTTAAATGAAGTVYAKVEGEGLGIK